jgi:hypothetical protein
MSIESIQAAIDEQIAKLQKVRSLLVSASAAGKRRGRPPASAKLQSIMASLPTAAKRTKRKMSAEGRARIIAAQKARWAKIRKTAKG